MEIDARTTLKRKIFAIGVWWISAKPLLSASKAKEKRKTKVSRESILHGQYITARTALTLYYPAVDDIVNKAKFEADQKKSITVCLRNQINAVFSTEGAEELSDAACLRNVASPGPSGPSRYAV